MIIANMTTVTEIVYIAAFTYLTVYTIICLYQ